MLILIVKLESLQAPIRTLLPHVYLTRIQSHYKISSEGFHRNNNSLPSSVLWRINWKNFNDFSLYSM